MEDVSGSHVLQGDVLDICSEIEDDYFDAVFCDPPYGLSKTRNKPEEVLRAWLDGEEADGSGGFMGKNWDGVVPGPRIWREIIRTMKPGGHLMAFGGTTTVDYLTIALRLAGFEVRDRLMYMYGTGFPKSHNISKALDKKAGAESEETTATERFDGYGTALKPAYEPIVLAMKPRGKSFADCALEHGVAGLNIDGGRVGKSGGGTKCNNRDKEGRCLGHNNAGRSTSGETFHPLEKEGDQGRFPTNLILDERAEDLLDEQTGDEKSRFFYTAKASKAEREAGLYGMKKVCGTEVTGRKKGDKSSANASAYTGTTERKRANTHPCVKPLDLCRYFATLLLPPKREDSRKILVPFSGSGSEMIGARAAGWEFVAGIEMEEEYCEIAEKRLEYWENEEIE